MGRIIAISDIHGCIAELTELLNLINPKSDDTIIQVGDMVNRGPDSAAVIKLIRENNIRALLGNHERRLLQYRWRRDREILKKYDPETIQQLGPRDWEYLENLPLFIYNADLQSVFVHGGFDPHSRLLWREQPASVVTTIQVIDSEGRPSKRSKAPDGKPWGDLWKGPPFVVYGHTPREAVRTHPYAIGIDTACVYGGALTACILPSKQIIQVKAHTVYARSKTLPQPVHYET